MRESLITEKWAVKEASDINTSHTLFGGGKIGGCLYCGGCNSSLPVGLDVDYVG